MWQILTHPNISFKIIPLRPLWFWKISKGALVWPGLPHDLHSQLDDDDDEEEDGVGYHTDELILTAYHMINFSTCGLWACGWQLKWGYGQKRCHHKSTRLLYQEVFGEKIGGKFSKLLNLPQIPPPHGSAFFSTNFQPHFLIITFLQFIRRRKKLFLVTKFLRKSHIKGILWAWVLIICRPYLLWKTLISFWT